MIKEVPADVKRAEVAQALEDAGSRSAPRPV